MCCVSIIPQYRCLTFLIFGLKRVKKATFLKVKVISKAKNLVEKVFAVFLSELVRDWTGTTFVQMEKIELSCFYY